MAWTITPNSYPLLIIRQKGLDDMVGNPRETAVRWSSLRGGSPEGSGSGRRRCIRTPTCQLSSQVAVDGIGSDVSLGQDLSCILDLITYHWWECQPNNFPFPSRELILGRCLALLVQCSEPLYWLTGTSRHLAHGNVYTCTHPKAHESCLLPNMGDSGFSREIFPVQVHGCFLTGLPPTAPPLPPPKKTQNKTRAVY